MKGAIILSLKELKKGISTLTFLFAIVALTLTCNKKVHAASDNTTEVSAVAEDAANEDSIELPEDNLNDQIEEKQEDKEESHKYDTAMKKVSMTKSLKRAKGLKTKVTFSNLKLDSDQYKIKWSSSKETVATVSTKGYVTMKAAGTATITAKITCDDNSVYTYKCKVTVTNPKFKESYYGLQVGGKVTLKVTGTTTTSYTLKIKDTKIAKKVSGTKSTLKAYKLGHTEVTTKIDGKTISCKVYVTSPKLSTKEYFVVKGSSEKIKIKNWSGKTQPTYKSSNKAVATVTDSGYIKGHKNGSCTITMSVEGKTLKCYVSVSNKTVIKMLESAYKCLGCKYSQARRMSKNYYDCSSFAWRNYSKYGVTFGSKNYAPTAAEEARNMAKTHKAIAYKYVSSSKLQPGDVLFVRSSSSNGRYRNIGHVAIYMGNGRIIHATPPKVCVSNYSRYSGRIALISRPTK